MKRVFQIKAKITENILVSDKYFHLILEAGDIARLACPGQFVQIKVHEALDPLLRRPFSIHRAHGKTIEVLYEKIGKATEVLAQRKIREKLDIIGPLGKGFEYSFHNTAVLVAGGMGVAPLLFLAEKIAEKTKPIVFIGARTKAKILCAQEFKQLGCYLHYATDDGSLGYKGRVTDAVREVLRANKNKIHLYACGPRPMLEAVTLLARETGVSSQISLEEHMACGIGACMGCVVNTKDGYQRVCKEGPVFNTKDLIWDTALKL